VSSTHPCVSREARLRRTKMFLTFSHSLHPCNSPPAACGRANLLSCKFVKPATQCFNTNQIQTANTKNALVGRIFLLVVEVAGVEPASANSLPLVLHA